MEGSHAPGKFQKRGPTAQLSRSQDWAIRKTLSHGHHPHLVSVVVSNLEGPVDVNVRAAVHGEKAHLAS